MLATLLLEKEPPLAWITFNKPERRNAVDLEMWEALPSLLAEVGNAAEVRVLLLRGAGHEAFVSGADISQFGKARSGPDVNRRYDRAVDSALKAIGELKKPVIAMIHGFCMGGGCSLAVMCDLRICSDDARFGIPAARLGIAYPIERGVERLVHVVGMANAMEILLTARTYDSTDAVQMGLVNRVLPKAEIESFTREYATNLASNAPLSVSAHKYFVNESVKDTSLRDKAKIKDWAMKCSESHDYREGVKAFMEKRRPKFLGK